MAENATAQKKSDEAALDTLRPRSATNVVTKRHGVMNAVPIPQPLHALAVESEEFVQAVYEISKPVLPAPDNTTDFRLIAHPGFFLFLLALGASLTFTTDDISPEQHMSELLFNSGLTPAVLYMWSFLLGYGLKRSQDAARVCFSLLLIGIGVSLDRGVNLEVLLYHGLFEIGALFFVEKFFFLASDDEKIIKDLQDKLSKAIRSPGTGMAMSYFYNFVLPTCACIYESINVKIDMEKSRGVFEEFDMADKLMYVFIPRNLNGIDLKKQLSGGTSNGLLKMGKPQPPKGDKPHRPLFMYFLEFDEQNRKCGGMCDVPTIISSCWDRQNDPLLQEAADRTGNSMFSFSALRGLVSPRETRRPLSMYDGSTTIGSYTNVEETIPQEIQDFENVLLELAQNHPETKDILRIVSVPCAPLNFSGLKKTVKELARKNKIQGEQNTEKI